MKRFAAIVAFAGAVILSTRILAPAAPPAAKSLPSTVDMAFIQQAAPMINQVLAARLTLRLRRANCTA